MYTYYKYFLINNRCCNSCSTCCRSVKIVFKKPNYIHLYGHIMGDATVEKSRIKKRNDPCYYKTYVFLRDKYEITNNYKSGGFIKYLWELLDINNRGIVNGILIKVLL